MRGCGITPFFVWTNSTFMWIYSTILQTFLFSYLVNILVI